MEISNVYFGNINAISELKGFISMFTKQKYLFQKMLTAT